MMNINNDNDDDDVYLIGSPSLAAASSTASNSSLMKPSACVSRSFSVMAPLLTSANTYEINTSFNSCAYQHTRTCENDDVASGYETNCTSSASIRNKITPR